MGEPGAFARDAVDVRRAERSIAVDARMRIRPVVGDGEDDVGAAWLRRWRPRRAHRSFSGCERTNGFEDSGELARLLRSCGGDVGPLSRIAREIVELRLRVVAG